MVFRKKFLSGQHRGLSDQHRNFLERKKGHFKPENGPHIPTKGPLRSMKSLPVSQVHIRPPQAKVGLFEPKEGPPLGLELA